MLMRDTFPLILTLTNTINREHASPSCLFRCGRPEVSSQLWICVLGRALRIARVLGDMSAVFTRSIFHLQSNFADWCHLMQSISPWKQWI